MRNLIRRLIKESIYDGMERDFTLRSGKTLQNFKGIMNALSSGPDGVNQAISVMEMIDPYSLYSDENVESKVQQIEETEYDVNLYFSDMEVAIAVYDFIKMAAESSPWSSFEDKDKFAILVFPPKSSPDKRSYRVRYHIRIP